MGKAEIVSGGDKGLYQIKIKAYTDRAKETIKKIDAELEEMESGPEVVFSPTLQQQATSISSLLDQYNQGIQENYQTERDNRELEKQLAYEQNQLSALESELSDLGSVRDSRETAYSNAVEDGGYTPEQIQYLLGLLNSAQVDVDVKQAEINSRQAAITGLQAQLDAIEYIDVDPLLKDAQAQIKTFYEWSEKEPLSQLDDHVDLGQSILSAMGTAFGSAIEWFQDAATTNVEDQLKLTQLKEDQLPVSDSVSQHQIDTAEAKSALDQKQSAYEEAYLGFLVGEVTEADLQAAADERDTASAAYSAELVSLAYWENQYDSFEQQKIECVAINTEPMQERLNVTAEAHNDVLYKQGALESFRDMQQLKKESLQKEKERLQKAMEDTEKEQDAWCADFTEDLTGEVATLEVNGEADTVLIRPAYDDRAVYVQARDGALMPPTLGTPAQAFYNYAMMPGWQKWKPTFRIGTISGMDGNNCNIDMEPAVSGAQELDINQSTALAAVPIDYMNCDEAVFQAGDRVIIEFQEQDWTKRKVIGFADHPKPCEDEILIVSAHGDNTDLVIAWDISRDDYAIIPDDSYPSGLIEFPCGYAYLLNTDWYKARASVKEIPTWTYHGYQDDRVIADELCEPDMDCELVGPGEHYCVDDFTGELLGYDYLGAGLYAIYYNEYWKMCTEYGVGGIFESEFNFQYYMKHPNIRFEQAFLYLPYDLPESFGIFSIVGTNTPPKGRVVTLFGGVQVVTNLQRLVQRTNQGTKTDPYAGDVIQNEHSSCTHYLNTPITGALPLYECTHDFSLDSAAGVNEYVQSYVMNSKEISFTLVGDRSFVQIYLQDILWTTKKYEHFGTGTGPSSYGMTDNIIEPRKLVGMCSATIVEDFMQYDPLQDSRSTGLQAAIELLMDQWYAGAGQDMMQIGDHSVAVDIIALV